MATLKSLVAFSVVVVSLYLGLQQQCTPRLPPHTIGENAKAFIQEELLSVAQANSLREILYGMKEFPTNAADTKFYKTLREHIGEALPSVNGTCSHPLLIPSKDKSLCVLPGRVDVAKHFIVRGGVEGVKEPYDVLTSRLQSFGRYMFDLSEYPEVEELFKTPRFQAAAKQVCPKSKQVLDPFQFNLILQVPGQTVALHLDAPYFWGASRFQFPQWLLAAMVFSGLFQDKFIDQVQVVGYLHEWEKGGDEEGGDFVYWNKNSREPEVVSPAPRTGVVTDGSKTVHAATIYKPGVPAPVMDKSKDNVLVFDKDAAGGEGRWHLMVDGKAQATYEKEDLRISVVYRARCFESEEQRGRYHSGEGVKEMDLEEILRTLTDDLIRRNKLSEGTTYDSIPRFDLAMAILDEYIAYPGPVNAIIPYNYCALGRLYPATNQFLAPFCGN